MSLFNHDFLSLLLFRLTLLTLDVFNYFLVILLNFHFTIVPLQFRSYFFDFYVCKPLVFPDLPSLICLYLLSYRKTPILFHIFFILYLYFLFLGSPLIEQTLNCNLVSCLFPFHSLFCLIHCLMTTSCGQIR